MKNLNVFCTVLLICITLSRPLQAQNSDSVKTERAFKNTVRFNFSAPLIFGDRYLVLGYERMVGTNQSFSINIGSFGLPNFVSSDSLKVSDQRKDKGFHVSADYRFYLAAENRHRAPRGVYIGPYYSYNHLARNNSWTFNTKSFSGNTAASLDVNIHTIGFELGYQFVFWKRFAVDMVAIGPGIAHYSFKSDISNSLTPENQSELLKTIAQKIREKIPASSDFLSDEHYKRDSGVATWSVGYRYIIHFGYRF